MEKQSELAKALIAFHKEVKPVKFDAENPYFKSKYATLEALVTASESILSKYGLAVIQLVENEGSVKTILIHESGENITSEPLTLKPVKDDPQGRGSAITYARRYSYASILGLVSDRDDDGNAASNGKPIEYISEKEAGIIRDLLISLEKSEEKFLAYMNIKSLETMPKSDLQKAMSALESAKKKVAK